MPINESTGIPRSNLTREQRRQAEAALYGLDMAEQDKPLTQEDVDKMRAIVAEADRKAGITEFDLNRPPREPYHYQAFPKMLYRQVTVNTQEELIVKTKEGWEEATYMAKEDAPPFPKVLVKHKVVASQEEMDKEAKDGWQDKPPAKPEAKQHHQEEQKPKAR